LHAVIAWGHEKSVFPVRLREKIWGGGYGWSSTEKEDDQWRTILERASDPVLKMYSGDLSSGVGGVSEASPYLTIYGKAQ